MHFWIVRRGLEKGRGVYIEGWVPWVTPTPLQKRAHRFLQYCEAEAVAQKFTTEARVVKLRVRCGCKR